MSEATSPAFTFGYSLESPSAGHLGLGGLAYAFFKWNDFISVVASTPPHLVTKLSVLVYYICWQFGAKIDLDLHKNVLAKDSRQGEFDVQLIAALILFILLAVGFMWASSREYVFAFALVIFWSVLTYFGQKVRDRTESMFYETGKWYAVRKRFADVEKTVRVINYFYGWEMKLRNKVGFVLVAVVCIVTIPHVRSWIGVGTHAAVPLLSEDTAAALAPSLAFAFFVVVTEVWQCVMRVRAMTAVAVLDGLKQKYYLEPYTD